MNLYHVMRAKVDAEGVSGAATPVLQAPTTLDMARYVINGLAHIARSSWVTEDRLALPHPTEADCTEIIWIEQA